MDRAPRLSGEIGAAIYIVMLKELAGERILSIWLDRFEASALALQLNEVATPRPMTFDLMGRLVEVAGARVENVARTMEQCAVRADLMTAKA